MLGDGFPTLSVVEFHPVVFAIFYFAAVFESLGKQVAKEVVVGGILKTQVTNIAQVLIEFVWKPEKSQQKKKKRKKESQTGLKVS